MWVQKSFKVDLPQNLERLYLLIQHEVSRDPKTVWGEKIYVREARPLKNNVFLVYVGDISDSSQMKINISTDNTTLFSNVRYSADLIQSGNNGLIQFYNWSVANVLSSNLKITNYMVVFNMIQSLARFALNRQNLNQIESSSFLGVVIICLINFTKSNQIYSKQCK